MRTTSNQIRRMTFDQINSEILTDSHRHVLAFALKRRSLCSETFYFNPDDKPRQAWEQLCAWGIFNIGRNQDRANPLASWYLSKMGAALAHHIAKKGVS